MSQGNKSRRPRRTCIVCRIKRDKAGLLRLALNEENRVLFDHQQLNHGRGAYVCSRPECLARVKLAYLQKAFRRSLPETAWNVGKAMGEALGLAAGEVASNQAPGNSSYRKKYIKTIRGIAWRN
jgi:predicted RNA-binding protein YlxR (DUF448 family)